MCALRQIKSGHNQDVARAYMSLSGSGPLSIPAASHPHRAVEGPQKDRHVMLPGEVLELLRQLWKARPTAHDAGVALGRRWLFPGRSGHQPLTRVSSAGCSRRPHSRGAAQDDLGAFASAQLRDPSARARNRHSRHSGVARTRQARDDGPLQSRGDRNDCQDRAPARWPERRWRARLRHRGAEPTKGRSSVAQRQHGRRQNGGYPNCRAGWVSHTS